MPKTDRLKQIRERLDAAEAKDRPNSGPYRATPERGPDDHRLARIWGPDGDCLAEVHGNLGLDIDGDALAEMWAHAPDDVAWLLGEVERLSLILTAKDELDTDWAWCPEHQAKYGRPDQKPKGLRCSTCGLVTHWPALDPTP